MPNLIGAISRAIAVSIVKIREIENKITARNLQATQLENKCNIRRTLDIKELNSHYIIVSTLYTNECFEIEDAYGMQPHNHTLNRRVCSKRKSSTFHMKVIVTTIC